MAAILVTGASRGIGLEFVRQYAAAGNRVFACARDPGRAEKLHALPNVSIHRLDVTSAEDIAVLTRALANQPIDILINNAGIAAGLHSGKEADEAEWLDGFRTNTMAPYRITRALRPQLERGTMRTIVTISSGRASHPRHKGEGYAYGASKAALNNVMFGMSVEWGKAFTFVLFAPGPVRSDMNVNGKLSADFSVGAMRETIARLTPGDSGRYVDYAGKDVLW